MSRIFNLLSLIAIVAVIFYACKPKSEPAPGPVDPNDPNALSRVLIFSNNTTQKSGGLPSNASTAKSTITNNPSLSVSTSGGTVYIPVAYSGSVGIAFAYIQVQGASTYFVIPVNSTTASGQFAIPVTFPATLQGDFVFLLQLVDSNGNVLVSKTVNIPVETTLPLSCGNGAVNGNAGITLTEHALNGKNGNVLIEYNTYSLPDRIDVFLDGKWVAGTGSAITPPPPLSTCSNPLAGFVGKAGTFSVPVTSNNKTIQVYVSGCTGSTTAWDYELTCP